MSVCLNFLFTFFLLSFTFWLPLCSLLAHKQQHTGTLQLYFSIGAVMVPGRCHKNEPRNSDNRRLTSCRQNIILNWDVVGYVCLLCVWLGLWCYRFSYCLIMECNLSRNIWNFLCSVSSAYVWSELAEWVSRSVLGVQCSVFYCSSREDRLAARRTYPKED